MPICVAVSKKYCVKKDTSSKFSYFFRKLNCSFNGSVKLAEKKFKKVS